MQVATLQGIPTLSATDIAVISPSEIAARVDDALQRQDELKPLRAAARRTVLERYDLKRVCLPAQLRLTEKLLGAAANRQRPAAAAV